MTRVEQVRRIEEGQEVRVTLGPSRMHHPSPHNRAACGHGAHHATMATPPAPVPETHPAGVRARTSSPVNAGRVFIGRPTGARSIPR